MDIHGLQAEINHLLFLYFTSVGSIQRDAGTPENERGMRELVREIAECRARIRRILEPEPGAPAALDDYAAVIEQGKAYIADGMAFIDILTDM